MEVRVNGLLAISGRLVEPKNGPWSARIEVDDEESRISSPVIITMGSETFRGWLVAGAVEQGRYIAQVVGGNGGLRRQLDAKYYYQAAIGVVLTDIMLETGEALDPESDAAITTFLVPRWARLLGEARLALKQVTRETGGFWRVTRAGNVLLKQTDTWLPVSMIYTEIERDPARGTVVLAPEAEPLARPGVTVGADRCAEVVTEWDSGSLRQVVTIDDEARPRGVANAILSAAQRTTQAAIDYSQWYPAKVIGQHADGSLELYPEDARIRGNGLTHVPLLLGVPGVSVKVPPGGRVRLLFENGDPKLPAAALWPDGSSVIEVKVGDAAVPLATAPAVEEQLAAISQCITALYGALSLTPVPWTWPDLANPTATVGTSKLKAE